MRRKVNERTELNRIEKRESPCLRLVTAAHTMAQVLNSYIQHECDIPSMVIFYYNKRNLDKRS
ncbi:hypothetical protein J6590_102348 [Homalodisca vitripennis]|nr:hypothetical protein J6590_102348 [Homalodisca vitripennis]